MNELLWTAVNLEFSFSPARVNGKFIIKVPVIVVRHLSISILLLMNQKVCQSSVLELIYIENIYIYISSARLMALTLGCILGNIKNQM